MDFCKISLRETPHILFAHTYESSYSTWPYLRDPKLVEITFLEQGSLRFYRENGAPAVFTGPCILVAQARFNRVEVISPFHRHHTFSFFSDSPIELITEQEFGHSALLSGAAHDAMCCVLPTCIPGGAYCDKIARNIRTIISRHQGVLLSDRLEVYKSMYDIFADAYRCAVEQVCAASGPAYISLYTTRAMQYVNAHLAEPIRVQDVAAALRISYGHLSRVFHSDTGIGLVRYINELKMKHIRELMLAKNMTLEEAGAAVGISNAKYLSRMFKEYNGMTATEYRKSCHRG